MINDWIRFNTTIPFTVQAFEFEYDEIFSNKPYLTQCIFFPVIVIFKIVPPTCERELRKMARIGKRSTRYSILHQKLKIWKNQHVPSWFQIKCQIKFLAFLVFHEKSRLFNDFLILNIFFPTQITCDMY